MNELILLAILATLGVQTYKQFKKGPSGEGSVTVTEYPSVPYGFLLQKSAKKWNVPFRVIVSIVDYESGFNANAVNYERVADINKGHNVDSVGLGQILYPDTAVSLDSSATYEKLLEPDYNLNLTGMLLSQLLKRYPSNDNEGFPSQAIAAYNAGSARYTTDGQFKNQSYVDGVRNRWYKWRML